MITVNKRNFWAVFCLIFIGISVWAVVGLRKTIILTIDGKSKFISTWAVTVNQLLNYEGIEVNENDLIKPSAGSLLADNSTVEIQQASTIQVEVDGENKIFYAVDPVPVELFSRAGITIHPGDQLFDANKIVPMNLKFQTTHENHFWMLKRAITATIHIDDITNTLTSTATTVGQALWENGFPLKFGDTLTPASDTLLTPDLEITIQSARPITILTSNMAVKLYTTYHTISESLIEAGFVLQGLDYTNPNENEPIPANGVIRLVHVTEDIMIEQTPIPFETTYSPTPDLEIDRQTVIEPGTNGINAQRLRIRYEDGNEVSRNMEEEWLARNPVNRIIGYGTQIVMRSMDTADGIINYWRALDMYAVSYKPSDTGSNITSTGQVLKKGIIAVNPNYIPYGTTLYIPGYGFGVAADTGRLSPRMVDLGYSDEDYVSWHQNVTVYFIWPPPANITWIIP